MYYVYVLRCKDNSLYTGVTTDFNKRLSQHSTKSPLAAKYTKSRQAVGVEALWTAPDRSLAQKLEYRIKRLSKMQKEELIKKPNLLEEYMKEKLDISQYKYIKDF